MKTSFWGTGGEKGKIAKAGVAIRKREIKLE
jgi:hypothetical protein